MGPTRPPISGASDSRRRPPMLPALLRAEALGALEMPPLVRRVTSLPALSPCSVIGGPCRGEKFSFVSTKGAQLRFRRISGLEL